MPNETVEEAIRRLVAEDCEVLPALAAAAQVEQEGKESWNWAVVGAHPSTLRLMSKAGILDVVQSSATGATFRLADAKLVETLLGDPLLEESSAADMFEEIVGYEDVKQFVRRALRAKKPVHALLIGTPGSAKTLFLDAVARLPNAKFLLGGTTSKAGLVRFLVDNPDCEYLLIDELDKVENPKILSPLLTLMENGRVIEQKKGQENHLENLTTKVFAAGNELRELPPELRQRFRIFHFDPYDESDFIEVVRRALMIHEECAPELASFIGEYCWNSGLRVVRDAIGLGRTCEEEEDVVWQVNTLLRHRRL